MAYYDADYRASVGERLRDARMMREMTQSQLADMCGIHTNSIIGYENGVASPSFNTAINIAKALKVSLDWLAGRKKR